MSQHKNIKIQELTNDQKSQHYYIEETDQCYYFGEYTASAGFAYSDTNQLVLNFKKSPEKKNKPEWIYKTRAIEQVSRLINDATNPQKDMIFVPIPPSKCIDDPLYDDRLVQVLNRLAPGWMGSGYRELIKQNSSTEASHLSAVRNIDSLMANYSINLPLIEPAPKGIIIFDDVLTTGCHYKAMQKTLKGVYPEANIIGMFLARRKIEEPEIVFGNLTGSVASY